MNFIGPKYAKIINIDWIGKCPIINYTEQIVFKLCLSSLQVDLFLYSLYVLL